MKKYNKYDWNALKLEFMQGPWQGISEFRRFKGMPDSQKNNHITAKTAGWTQEKRKFLAQATQKATTQLLEAKTEDIKDIRERQARLARLMQLKGAESLKRLDPEDADQARKMVVSGLEEERTALGINPKSGAASLTQVNVNLPRTTFDEILEGATFDELMQLIAEIRRERVRRAEVNIKTSNRTE